MPGSLHRIDELFPYRPLEQMLAGRRQQLHAVGPGDSVAVAVRRMARHHVGLVLVLNGERLVGVLSERDLVRHAGSADPRPLRELRVDELMTREVATVPARATFGDCIALMDARGVRHLPVMDTGRVVAVVSVRDLLREAVAHHRLVVAEMERERLAAFQSLA